MPCSTLTNPPLCAVVGCRSPPAVAVRLEPSLSFAWGATGPSIPGFPVDFFAMRLTFYFQVSDHCRQASTSVDYWMLQGSRAVQLHSTSYLLLSTALKPALSW